MKKENGQHKSNSLLATATNKKLGASRMASNAMRSGARAPVNRVECISDSWESDLTGFVDEEFLPETVIKEIPHNAFNVDGSSSNSSSSSAEGFTMISGGDDPNRWIDMENKVAKTPSQPYVPTASKVVKQTIYLQKGIRLTAPAPMSFDRVKIQMGQEHTAPESREYRVQQEKEQKKQEEELKKKQHERNKLKAKLRKIKQATRDQGEGFEVHLGNFAESTIEEKKIIDKRMHDKINPMSPETATRGAREENPYEERKSGHLSLAEARFLARKAMDASKQRRGKDVQ
jgi:hypothetical protein